MQKQENHFYFLVLIPLALIRFTRAISLITDQYPCSPSTAPVRDAMVSDWTTWRFVDGGGPPDKSPKHLRRCLAWATRGYNQWKVADAFCTWSNVEASVVDRAGLGSGKLNHCLPHCTFPDWGLPKNLRFRRGRTFESLSPPLGDPRKYSEILGGFFP